MANYQSIKYKLLSQLSAQILSTIKSMFIFGESGSDLIFITNDDKVFGFGLNSSGLLGFGHNIEVKEPQIIDELCGKELIKIDWSSSGYGIGLTQSGALYQWGYELDDNEDEEQYYSPTVIVLPDIRVTDVSRGRNVTHVLSQTGEVYRLIYEYIECETQKLYFNNEKVIAISSGFYHCLALTELGNVFVWGQNSYGQLGLGINRTVVSATKINSLRNIFLSKIICGQNHSLLLTDKGEIYGFGYNGFGQLGVGDKANRNKPTLITDCPKFVDIFSDKMSNISMALSEKGVVYVWGETRDEVIKCPQKTEFKTFQDAINKYCERVFTHKFIEYKELFEYNESRVLKVMSNAFNNPKDSDLKLKIVENNDCKYIFVHKWFVRENSKHFEAMFSNEWSESNRTEIEIKEHTYDSYYAFIRFLYVDSITTQDMNVLIQLLDIANEYLEEDLKYKCSQTLKPLITVQNVCDVYSGAVKYNCVDLENYCFEFMTKVTNVLTKTESYERMDPIYAKHFNTKYLEYMCCESSPVKRPRLD